MNSSSSDCARLIESALAASAPTIDFSAEREDTIQVERGLILPLALLRQPRDTLRSCVDRLLTTAPQDVTIVDQRTHRRHAYRGLLVYATLLGLTLGDHGLTNWPDRLRPLVDSISDPPAFPVADSLPASWGAQATEVAWNALALHVAAAIYNQPTWRESARQSFHHFATAQQPAGPFLRATASDNPETHWYHELVLLHAMASYGAQTADAAIATAVARNAAFHMAETQPDHATNQPWALHAFAQHPDTHPFADQLLHAATMVVGAGGSGGRGLTSILLADALYSLQLSRATPMTTPNQTTLDPTFLSILRCPLTRSPLRQEGQFLVAEVGGLRYPLRDGFPVMLVEEAELPEGVESLDEFRQKFAAQIPARP
jgi:uncharacterized protein YbaR (Trm112 family)